MRIKRSASHTLEDHAIQCSSELGGVDIGRGIDNAGQVSLLIFVFVSVYMYMYDILLWLLKLNRLTSSFSRPNHQSGENLVCGLLS